MFEIGPIAKHPLRFIEPESRALPPRNQQHGHFAAGQRFLSRLPISLCHGMRRYHRDRRDPIVRRQRLALIALRIE